MSTDKDIRRIMCVTMQSLPGDVAGNAQKIACRLREAAEMRADLVVFPELCLTGYIPLTRRLAIRSDAAVLGDLAGLCGQLGVAASVGYFEDAGQREHIAQAFLHGGRIQSVYRKIFAHEKGVTYGQAFETVDWQGAPTATIICLELHFPLVTREHAKRGALVILHPSAYRGDSQQPQEIDNHNVYLPRARAKENGVFFLHVNASGCPKDGRYCLGNALAVAPDGRILGRIDPSPLQENVMVVDIDLNEARSARARMNVAEEAARLGCLDDVPLPGE